MHEHITVSAVFQLSRPAGGGRRREGGDVVVVVLFLDIQYWRRPYTCTKLM
uniref:Uncharacterized protein n=1 Tax=Nelumbo nucifera TaxID=4432 RepID=A0A822ZJL4_NELNU|nr:TPA_asm: hypothetical protein HUJ06_003153 [Nelumbo nucifera]